jgi:hypothetical protein
MCIFGYSHKQVYLPAGQFQQRSSHLYFYLSFSLGYTILSNLLSCKPCRETRGDGSLSKEEPPVAIKISPKIRDEQLFKV